MEKLDHYISGLFARMPDTANRIELESKVRNEADERYRMLLDEGYNEAEALGLVIPRINEQEILKQLHYPRGAAGGDWLGIQYENPAYVVVGFFAPVAVAVFIFVLYGTRQASYTNFFRAKEFYEYLSPEVSERLRRQKACYRDYAGERRFREFD